MRGDEGGTTYWESFYAWKTWNANTSLKRHEDREGGTLRGNMTTASSSLSRFYYSPYLLLVLHLQLGLRHLCDPFPQEPPLGQGTLVAPEVPVDPVDQELPAEHKHCQRIEQIIQTHRGIRRKQNKTH